ncbi:Uncharacterised protein [Mycobacteroides abscessus subsp. abscessus]|uniref:hypothetical protein n=1 Tax=Mycobacteroides abscessus TaxID=36809 RepID=UPI00092759F0|nr:hypothetical protein [Mycobacteroides abscessus]SHU66389.1 Uncharacterised protein [Mycobacteroides abscessus subsp. abscessus]
MDDEQYRPGDIWSSKDGKRNVVIVAGLRGLRGTVYTIRNLTTGRDSRIERPGLVKKFRHVGFDPAFKANNEPSTDKS